jgi:multimeric flavodoxin WrbA
MTSILKAFIDRLYGMYLFSDERPGFWKSQLADQGRRAIVAAIGEQKDLKEGGMDLTLATLRLSIEALGYEIVEELPVLGIFAKGKIKEYPQILKKADILGKQLGTSL